MGTATTKDITSITNRVNQLITTQTMQQETTVYIVCILNISRYAAQVNRQCINILMVHDVNNLYNIAVYQSELSSTGTSHQICFSKSLGFTILHQNSFHVYYGLH